MSWMNKVLTEMKNGNQIPIGTAVLEDGTERDIFGYVDDEGDIITGYINDEGQFAEH